MKKNRLPIFALYFDFLPLILIGLVNLVDYTNPIYDILVTFAIFSIIFAPLTAIIIGVVCLVRGRWVYSTLGLWIAGIAIALPIAAVITIMRTKCSKFVPLAMLKALVVRQKGAQVAPFCRVFESFFEDNLRQPRKRGSICFFPVYVTGSSSIFVKNLDFTGLGLHLPRHLLRYWKLGCCCGSTTAHGKYSRYAKRGFQRQMFPQLSKSGVMSYSLLVE